MDHKLAELNHAVDRYLLDEFRPEERMEFEEHLFDCPVCADQVRRDAVSIDNLKQVLLEEKEQRRRARAPRSWLTWFRPATLIPSFAALAMAVMVGYQNFVYIPHLERPQVLSTAVIAPLARDEGPVVAVDRSLPRFNLSFEVDSPRAYPSYTCEFQKDGGPTMFALNSGPRQVASFTLEFLLPTKGFPPGRYIMILRPASEPQTEIHRYSFTIQDEGSKT
ncbi:MAG: zf-HC2 domain-containing protein [Bryobacteraceae bacterium]